MKLTYGPHDLLIESLAAQLVMSSRLVFCEVPLGSRWGHNGKVPVPDVLTLQKSFTRPLPTIYEVKATRADLRGDLRAGKWERYLEAAWRFVFATGPDVGATAEDIPAGCGWMAYNPEKQTWVTRIAAPRRDGAELSSEELLTLLFAKPYAKRKDEAQRKAERSLRVRRRAEARDIGAETAARIAHAEKAEDDARVAASRLARALSDISAACGMEMERGYVWHRHGPDGWADHCAMVREHILPRLDDVEAAVAAVRAGLQEPEGGGA